MNINNDYANLLELYANIIRGLDVDLSKEQKEIIKKLGETFFERIDNDVKNSKKECLAKKVVKNSEFESIRKKREMQKKCILGISDFKLAKDIGKEPGE